MSSNSTNFDVIVLGIGGMGSATCYHLAKRGLRVLGLEQFQIGHAYGSSHGETRAIRRAYFEHPDYIPLLNRAYDLWEGLAAEAQKDILTKNGMVIYGNPTTSTVYQGTLLSALTHDIPLDEMTSSEALDRFPMYQPSSEMGALFEPGAGFLQVEMAVRAHAELATASGAFLREGVCVKSYHATKDHVNVHTDQGDFTAAKLVITGGPWNTKLLKDLGMPLKLQRIFQCWFKASKEHDLKQDVPCFAFHLSDDFYYGFPMLDGKTIKIASHASGEPINDPSEKRDADMLPSKLALLQKFIRMYLPYASTELARKSPCIYTMTPDENFIIDSHPQHPNVSFATGFSGHGFKFSTVVGEILADLAQHGKTSHPIDFLKIRKFT